MWSMAGFSPSIQGNFYLLRAKTLPPQSLEQAVWPFVDEWLMWFVSGAQGRLVNRINRCIAVTIPTAEGQEDLCC